MKDRLDYTLQRRGDSENGLVTEVREHAQGPVLYRLVTEVSKRDEKYHALTFVEPKALNPQNEIGYTTQFGSPQHANYTHVEEVARQHEKWENVVYTQLLKNFSPMKRHGNERSSVHIARA